MSRMSRLTCWAIVAALSLARAAGMADENAGRPDVFRAALKPVFQQRCVACHGKKKGPPAAAKVNLLQLESAADLTAKPALLTELIEALDSGYMPPESEPALPSETRSQLVSHLRILLQTAVRERPQPARTPIRRMNRFQYSNAVQDLFQLNVQVFPLPERILREHGNYFPTRNRQDASVVEGGQSAAGKIADDRAEVGRRDAVPAGPASRAWF